MSLAPLLVSRVAVDRVFVSFTGTLNATFLSSVPFGSVRRPATPLSRRGDNDYRTLHPPHFVDNVKSKSMLDCSIQPQIRMSESQEPPPPPPPGGDQAKLDRHQQFIACLERHGPNLTGEEWPQMAQELGWSIEEVQVHAYQYLTMLFETDSTPSSSEPVATSNGGPAASATQTRGKRDRPWSLDESVLFDTLIATYGTPQDVMNEDGVGHGWQDWDELVASHMPGRTAAQVRRRYRQLYRNTSGDGSQGNPAG